MRALTWVSAGMLSLASGTWLFAQDSAKAEAHDHGPPLSIHLLPSDGSYLQYELSDPAYVAAFEVYSGGGAELLYPYASSDYAEVVGMHVHELSYLTDEVEERQALLASYPLQASWACVYVVASRQPLRLDGFATHPLALAASLGYHSVSMTNPEAGLAPILDSERPANPGDWATDELCGPIGQAFALAGPTYGYFAERPFIPSAASAATFAGSGAAVPVGPFRVGVCVVHRGDPSSVCGPTFKVPFKPGHGVAAIKDRPVVMQPAAVTKAKLPAPRIGVRENRPPSAVEIPQVRATTSQFGSANGGDVGRSASSAGSSSYNGSLAGTDRSGGSTGSSHGSSSYSGNSGGRSSSANAGGSSSSANSGGSSSSSGNSGSSSSSHSGGGYSGGGGYTGGGGYSGGGSFGGGGGYSGGGGASSGGGSAGGKH